MLEINSKHLNVSIFNESITFISGSYAKKMQLFQEITSPLHSTNLKYQGINTKIAQKSFKYKCLTYISSNSNAISTALSAKQNILFSTIFHKNFLLKSALSQYFKLTPEELQRTGNSNLKLSAILPMSEIFLTNKPIIVMQFDDSHLSSEDLKKTKHLMETKAYDGKSIVIYTTNSNNSLNCIKEIKISLD